MADTLMRLISHVNNLAPRIQYPFLIIQDPDDKICNFEGAEIFLRLQGAAKVSTFVASSMELTA